METIIEKVTVTTTDGRVAKFSVAYDPQSYAGQRAYLDGSTLYYDMHVFVAGLRKAAKVDREQIADMFEHPASQVCAYHNRA